jgi:hypothetical protein
LAHRAHSDWRKSRVGLAVIRWGSADSFFG